MSRHRVVISGQYWTIRFVSRLTGYGDCDWEKRTVRLRNGQTKEELLDTLIHEILHAGDPHKTEEWVEQTANSLTAAIKAIGLLDLKET